MRLVWFGTLCIVLFGCSGEAQTTTPEAPPPEGMDPDDSASSDGVRSAQVSGVWVFSHGETDYNLASLRGTAAVTRDCLVVDGYVVIWPESLIADAQNAVTDVQAGREVTIRLAGSQTQREHPEVAENCPGFPMWFGGPAESQ